MSRQLRLFGVLALLVISPPVQEAARELAEVLLCEDGDCADDCSEEGHDCSSGTCFVCSCCSHHNALAPTFVLVNNALHVVDIGEARVDEMVSLEFHSPPFPRTATNVACRRARDRPDQRRAIPRSIASAGNSHADYGRP